MPKPKAYRRQDGDTSEPQLTLEMSQPLKEEKENRKPTQRSERGGAVYIICKK